MVILGDVVSNGTINPELCRHKALFLSQMSWDDVGFSMAVATFLVLFMFFGFTSFDWTLLSEDDNTVKMSAELHGEMELLFAFQTIGFIFWGLCDLAFWLMVQKS